MASQGQVGKKSTSTGIFRIFEKYAFLTVLRAFKVNPNPHHKQNSIGISNSTEKSGVAGSGRRKIKKNGDFSNVWKTCIFDRFPGVQSLVEWHGDSSFGVFALDRATVGVRR